MERKTFDSRKRPAGKNLALIFSYCHVSTVSATNLHSNIQPLPGTMDTKSLGKFATRWSDKLTNIFAPVVEISVSESISLNTRQQFGSNSRKTIIHCLDNGRRTRGIQITCTENEIREKSNWWKGFKFNFYRFRPGPSVSMVNCPINVY